MSAFPLRRENGSIANFLATGEDSRLLHCFFVWEIRTIRETSSRRSLFILFSLNVRLALSFSVFVCRFVSLLIRPGRLAVRPSLFAFRRHLVLLRPAFPPLMFRFLFRRPFVNVLCFVVFRFFLPSFRVESLLWSWFLVLCRVMRSKVGFFCRFFVHFGLFFFFLWTLLYFRCLIGRFVRMLSVDVLMFRFDLFFPGRLHRTFRT